METEKTASEIDYDSLYALVQKSPTIGNAKKTRR
jgi:hypothetical protein